MDLLVNGARELLGLEIDANQLARFQVFYEELVTWNERTNLTAITTFEEVQTRHFLDSLTLASPKFRADPPNKLLDLNKASLVDVGAGAGFPGLPLKIIYPGLQLTLADSVGKKTAFLQHITAKLELNNVTILNLRAEEIGRQPLYRAKFDIATGRAVAALAVLAEYCLPLCKIGGLFIAPKKGDLGEELVAGQGAISKLGGRLRQTPVFELPGENNNGRRLIVVEKVSPTSNVYPRLPGQPAKNPLT